jgi:hypothetical protein
MVKDRKAPAIKRFKERIMDCFLDKNDLLGTGLSNHSYQPICALFDPIHAFP